MASLRSKEPSNWTRYRREKRYGGNRRRGAAKNTGRTFVVRDGGVRSKPVEIISAGELKTVIRENVDKGARIMTDELPLGIGIEFLGGHKTVNHLIPSRNEVAKDN